MEILNQNHILFNNINNFNVLEKENDLNNPEVNELSPSLQISPSIITSLGNINEVSKFYEMRNAILSNKNAENEKILKSSPLSNAYSIIIPNSADYGIIEKKQNLKTNFSIKNIASDNYFDNFSLINNKMNIPNITVPNEVKPINQKSAFDASEFKRNPLSPQYNNIDMKFSGLEDQENSQYPMKGIMNNFDASLSNPSLVNMNLSTYMPISTTNSISENHIPYTTSTLSATMNSNSFATNNNEFDKNTLKKRIDLMEVIKFINAQKQLEINDFINENKNSNVLSPSNNYQINNQLINSITIPSETENNVSPYLQLKFTDDLLKQQQAQQQSASIFNNIISNNNMNDILNKQVENIKMTSDISSIIVDNISSDAFQSSQSKPILLENNNNLSIDDDAYDIYMRSSTVPKHEEVNKYKPLSPELSPPLNMHNYSTNNHLLQKYMKKNENNAFSSTDTLNYILSISPEMDTLDIPDYKDSHVCEKVENENEISLESIQWDNFFESIKNGLDDINVDNNFLNTPETPKSPSDFNSTDLKDFPNLTAESIDNIVFHNENIMNDVINNESIVPNISSYEDNDESIINENNASNIIVNDVEEKVQPYLSEQNQSQNQNDKEKPKVTKRPRGRPRKKRIEEPPKSPKVEIEEISELKKECFDHDYKFVKQDKTLNYILVTNQCTDNSIRQNNENNTKSISEATESQYDIPMKNNVKAKIENNSNHSDCECKRIKEVSAKNKNTISDNDSKESFVEEESLLTRKREIQQQKCTETNHKETKGSSKDNVEKSDEKNIKSQKVESNNSIQINNNDNNKVSTRISRKRKRQSKEDNTSEKELMDKEEVYVSTVSAKSNKRKVVRLSIKEIKSSIENGNRLSIGNSLGTNNVSALTQNGLVLVGRKRMIAENTNRPYVCSTCGAGFVRKHDLNRHEKVHTGIKNYKCPYCERAFSRNDALTRHLRVELKHRSQNDEENKKKKSKK